MRIRPTLSEIKPFQKFAALALAATSIAAGAQAYKVTNIVSDGSVPAILTDPAFLNPWAISSSGTWWISTENSGMNFVVPATVLTSQTPAFSFKVVVPTAVSPNTLPGTPTGSVTTGGAVGMLIPANATKASFLFSTIDGTISGWNSKLGTAGAISSVIINNSSAGAQYNGLAILNIATAGVTSASYILAPNFGTGNAIEVYDSTFVKTKLAGTFTDPNLPAGYAPYSVHVLGTTVYVAYALRTTAVPFHPVPGAGNGVIDAFDNAGNFVSRVVTGGNLNTPWGVAIAPANFGIYSNDLLIGNFADGIINVYDPKTFAYLGQLIDSAGKPLTYAALWELLPGGTAVTGTTGVSGGDTSTVYFTAGLANQAHGLFGAIANTTTAGANPTFGFSTSQGAVTVTAGSSATSTISLAPVNGFSGSVTMVCAGLPVGASCSFAPSTMNVAAGTVTTGTLTINTTKATAVNQPPAFHHKATGVTMAMLLPFASIFFLRRRKGIIYSMRSLPTIMIFFVGLGAASCMMGCADNSGVTIAPAPTPAGTSTITINAIATVGTAAQTTSFSLTVK